jgi:hypothetical protein
MACGCKNRGTNVPKSNDVVKTTSGQEATPQKQSNGNRIIKREIR